MVTGLLKEAGLWLGTTFGASPENAKGFFENVLLREKLQKQALRLGGFDPLGVRALPPPDWRPQFPNFGTVVAAMINAQGYDGGPEWGFKDPKLALTWRIWQQHFPDARWIIVRRSPEDVIASCLRTRFMKLHSTDRAYWQAFVDAYQLRLAELRQEVAWSREIDSRPIVAGDMTSLRRLTDELGLAWREEMVREFVAPDLWRGAS